MNLIKYLLKIILSALATAGMGGALVCGFIGEFQMAFILLVTAIVLAIFLPNKEWLYK